MGLRSEGPADTTGQGLRSPIGASLGDPS